MVLNVHRNKTELFFYSGQTRLVFTCVFGRYVASTVVSRSEGADGVGGQLRGDKREPLQWRNQIWHSLEEGAGKQYSIGVWMLD